MPIEQLETVAVSHKTSRADDPHRHMHFQIGTRVWATEAWRGLDTAALFRQQGAIRSLGTAVIAAHPQLAAVLDGRGLTLDPGTGEVAELQPFNAVMSKRAEQISRNLAQFEEGWRATHPDQDPGPAMMLRLIAMAWDHERPHKRPTTLGTEAAWRAELEDAGYPSGRKRVPASETRLRDMLAAGAARAGRRPPDVRRLARGHGLDAAQARAAAAVASTDPLVVVEGAAGAGKTTMLAAAIEATAAHGRATRVITPTKKAADVAHQELGVATDSVAKLVHEHGWRWSRDGVWTRLTVGHTDPATDAPYTGPAASARLVRGERIVVDEAGMLNQDTALALLTVANEHGATLALVGDREQLAAIGRGGVLDMAAQLLPRAHAMTTVHRFADPGCAALTVQLRRGERPASLFDRLQALGLVVMHESPDALHDALAREWRDGDAVTVATNDEARELNTCIRDDRVRASQVDDHHTATGSDGLSIGCGDVIQTRRNDSAVHVANRQTWIVQSVGDDGAVWAKQHTSSRKQRTVRLSAEYVAEHTHLAYASTAYGMQGSTVCESHTILGDAMDAAGVYVGMTRGRKSNRLHLVAADLDDAREQFVLALECDRADRGLANATAAARESVRGLAIGTKKQRREQRKSLISGLSPYKH